MENIQSKLCMKKMLLQMKSVFLQFESTLRRYLMFTYLMKIAQRNNYLSRLSW
jgi:hypothetical protein